MELIDKEHLLIENSKSCKTETAMPSVRSISTQTNAIDIAMIKENESHIATISQCIQTEIPSNILFVHRRRDFFRIRGGSLKWKWVP